VLRFRACFTQKVSRTYEEKNKTSMNAADFDTLHEVDRHKHLYQFYKTVEDYVEDLSGYFRSGLDKGEACVWIASEKMGLSRLQDLMALRIPGLRDHRTAGRIQIFSAEAWYLKNGRFDPAQALSNAEREIRKLLEAGYKAIRGAGDASAIPHEDWPELEPYEHSVTQLVRQAPVIALCAYPILHCTLRETKMVIDVHDDVMVGRI
jgi:MEDS: MEthanogen/methylotroph, DcmR Sensory domain